MRSTIGVNCQVCRCSGVAQQRGKKSQVERNIPLGLKPRSFWGLYGTTEQAAEKVGLGQKQRPAGAKAQRILGLLRHDFTACGKTHYSAPGFVAVVFFRHPAAGLLLLFRLCGVIFSPAETRVLRPYCAGISFCMRSRLWAAAISRNSHSTLALPRSFTCRAARSCLAQPKTFSTSFRLR